MEIRKILAVRTDRFGEFLLIIPALRALKEKFPQATLSLAVDTQLKELAEAIACVDEVIPWEKKKRSWGALIRAGFELKKKQFDLCVVFNPTREFHLISFFAGIPVRLGYARKCGWALNRKIPDTKHCAREHEIEYNLALVRVVNAVTADKTLSISINNDIINTLCGRYSWMYAKHLVAVHPWTSDPVKQWPLERFCELAVRLAEVESVAVVIVGAAQEKNAGTVFDGLGKRIFNMTGATTLLELAALLSRCKVLVSGDSGPVHLAGCVGVPVVALFRNDLAGKGPQRWGPRCKGSVVIEKTSLEDITVEEVRAALMRVLGA